jgi:predicted dehydrogenase
MKQVNIGLIGASWFADLWYLPVLQLHPNVKLQAICSRTESAAKTMAVKYGIERIYTNYKKMLEEEALDGVCIITPNHLHRDVALYSIQKGLHVMCEKPLALDSNEAKQMVSQAQMQNVVHAVNFTYRGHPFIKKMKELIETDLIGKPLEARFEYTGDYGLNGPPGWRGDIQEGGTGGVLQDLGSHLIDLSHYIVQQKITKVKGSLKVYENGQLQEWNEKQTQQQAADSVSFLADFSQGLKASFFISWVAPQGDKRQTIEMVVYGEKGTSYFMTCELGSQLRYSLKGQKWEDIIVEGVPPIDFAGGPSEEKFRPWRLTEKNEVWKWIDQIIHYQKNNVATFEDGYEVQKVIDAVIESAIDDRNRLVE